MKYELFQISTNEPMKRVQDFAETPPNIAHKDMEWRLYVAPPPAPETDEQRRQRLKWERTIAVQAITVTTTAGNTFDGDETSQTRMEKAASSLHLMTAKLAAGNPIELPPAAAPIYRVVDGIYQMIWVLADNTPTFVTADELDEAKILSGAAQAAIWVIA